MTGKKTTKIKYVYLEMIHDKSDKQDVIAGLFQGVYESGGETYILLQGLNGVTSVLNISFYSFMTLEMMEPDYKNMTYFTAEQKDQDTAFTMVKGHYTELMDAGFGFKAGGQMLDSSKYSEVPKEYLEGKPAGSGQDNKASTSTGPGNFVNRSRFQQNQAGNFTKTPIKKDPEPAVFGRSKTKKPSKDALALMIEKINAIQGGELEPVMPELAGELPAEEPDDDDDVYGNQYMTG